ncbi:MAG TPA: ABC transporter permease [Vicinamibacterales bacterium]|nr:ABC transporter permease [Vicinamibacterales bacterium]
MDLIRPANADAVRDASHAVRMLLKAPAFTAIVLLVFAIGIGATTAIVSIADAFFLRALPVSQPERVMTISQYYRDTGTSGDVSPGNAIDWVERAGSSRSFEAMALVEPWSVNSYIPGGEPEYLEAARVSEQFFAVLGTPLLHGRSFLPQEYLRGSGRFAILSFPMWRDRFGADPSVVGRAVQLSDRGAYTIVGVLPQGLELRLFNNRGARPEPSLWLPKQGAEGFEPSARGRAGYWNVLGRLRPGVSLAQANAELDMLSEQLAREYPQTNKNVTAHVVPLRTHLVGSLRGVLPLLLGAAVMLLTVACANVANLLLARGVARGREFAVRQALGASRFRLARQMLVESLLLATAGGALGLALARWMLDVIARLRPMDVARVDQIPIDLRAAAIAFGVAIVAAIVAGLAPSIQLSRPVAAGALRDGLTSARGGMRGALVVLEVAAAVVLAVGAGLLVRSFVTVQRVDPGFRPARVAALQIFPTPRHDTPQKRILFFEQVLDRIRALPGVVVAGAVSAMPFGVAQVAARSPLAIDGRVAATGDEARVLTTSVAGDYFRVMGVPLLKGRLFEASDTAASRQVVLVSRQAAHTLWPGADPIGSRVQFRLQGADFDAEVVGVVGDVHHEALDRPAAVELFIPHAQSGFYTLTVVVNTAPGSPPTLQTLKEQVWALDPAQTIHHTAAVEDWISRSLDNRRFSLFLLSGFALATLLLAAAGVYGVTSFTTGQRTREFGVRMTLGAKGRDIIRLVVGGGMKLAGVGVIIGILLALPLTRLLQAFLFGVTPLDALTFVSVAIGFVAIAAAACYVPAQRAISVDPAKALRFD